MLKGNEMNRDKYDEAIDAVMEECYHGSSSIFSAWMEGGKYGESTAPSALLFRTCPTIGCCLTEVRQNMTDISVEEWPDVLHELKDDDEIPSSGNELSSQWDAYIKANNESGARALLARFADYNRRLDVEYPQRKEI